MYVKCDFCECHFLSPSPVRPNARRGRNPDDRCRHPPDYIAEGHCRRDITESQDNLSD
ncbi:unnamed protein product [Staurois parvus]|uniref:Uncharacterized protein n=1 Tax=Staurois parvus TaxID=386267 RepID=A0ABN9CHY6_9NEOB|nr:unnamed protein product [Staurois parvus]